MLFFRSGRMFRRSALFAEGSQAKLTGAIPMYGYNLVAVYPTLEEARHVSDRLLAEGVNPADVRLTDAAMTQGAGRVAATRATGERRREPHHGGGFFDWLFASDVPEYDRDRYS